jgi:hypothetical protein
MTLRVRGEPLDVAKRRIERNLEKATPPPPISRRRWTWVPVHDGGWRPDGGQGPSPDPDAEVSTAEARASQVLRRCARELIAQADYLEQHGTASRRAREGLKRILSGVLADVETVRLAVRD